MSAMDWPSARRASVVIGVLLAVELVDELLDGVLSATWPAIRADLALSYGQVGLLVGLLRVAGSVAEVPLGILADMGWRRPLLFGGGAVFCLALGAVGAAPGFGSMAVALAVLGPASGAFVGLSQTALMDLEPSRREKNMTRWALAGTAGNLAGPVLVGASLAVGWGWRPAFVALIVLALGALLALHVAAPHRSPGPLSSEVGTEMARGSPPAFWEGLRRTLEASRRGVARWLLLLELADLMLDVFRSYLALYLVEVAGADQAAAGVGVVVLTGAGLAGAAALVRLLKRVPGVSYLRGSAALALLVFSLFLVMPHLEAKLVTVGVLGVLTSGWYPVLKAKLYEALPGQSGAAVTLSTLSGMVGGMLPVVLGAVSGQVGLANAMWFLLAGPLALLVGVPRGR